MRGRTGERGGETSFYVILQGSGYTHGKYTEGRGLGRDDGCLYLPLLILTMMTMPRVICRIVLLRAG